MFAQERLTPHSFANLSCFAQIHEVQPGPLYVSYMYLFGRDEYNLSIETSSLTHRTDVPANSDSDVVLCLQLLSKTLTRTFHLSWGNRLRIGLIHK